MDSDGGTKFITTRAVNRSDLTEKPAGGGVEEVETMDRMTMNAVVLPAGEGLSFTRSR